MDSHTGEPIAIVGMACRFPGAADLNDFWRLLEAGGNAVSEGDPGSGVGRMGLLFGDHDVQSEACRFGAFVDDIDRFDAPFFRISPVEAELLDPQQRMMLETSWLALEDAGIDPAALTESRTGVYTGISNDEYRMLVVDSSRPTAAAGSLYALSGTNLNGTSGRVSFVLGLRGPAKAVDAACASALVAVHDAVADLQSGKADLAIAAGVQAILNGRIYELRAEAMMLSPDGQCKAFDASANGYVRGEGCGVVVLKRLSEAEADGDRIWAVIRGAAVNHGGASVGLTVPHTPALIEVIETALSDAGVSPADIDYLEAHGTGTAVGDPIEIDAAANVLSRGRDEDRPLLVGSVKTNIGHLESAAGIAGLMKAALVLKRGIIPKHLHFHDPNPSLDWDSLPLRVTSEMVDLPPRDRPRLAGVNSFGISGTNAHVVVEEYRGPSGAAAAVPGSAATEHAVGASLPESVAHLPLPLPDGRYGPRPTRFLPLSGRSGGAVRDLAGRYLAWLDERPGEPLAQGAASEPVLSDMAWTAGVGRSHFDYRSGAIFNDVESLRARLTELAEDGAELKPTSPGALAFVYTGQGSQWVGMGQALYETEPVARAVLDRCEAVFREVRGASLLDVMFGRDGGTGDLGDTAWEQPALYALGCALTALWASVGVRPEVVVGHSVGEIAAAQAAGVFSLEDGMRFAAARGTLLADMEAGGMAAVFATPEQVAAAVEAHNATSASVGLSIAADNGAHQVVSGPVADIEAMSERLESERIRVRRLNTAKAFHSALVDPVLDGLDAALEGVETRAPSLTVISNLTGRPVEPGMALDASYWRRHARNPVAFASGVSALSELGVDVIVEIGPDSVLGTMARLAWPSGPGASAAPSSLASLRRPRRDDSSAEPLRGFVHAVAAAYDAGLSIRFEGLFAGEARRRISLPGYPFQRERHWLERPRQRRLGAGHALLGARHESAGGGITFETEMFTSDPAWLEDHRVFGRVVMPGAVYGAMAAAAALAESGGGAVTVDDMQLHSALVFPQADLEDGTGQDSRTMQVLLETGDRGTARGVRVFSRGPEGEWTAHVEARVSTSAPSTDGAARMDLDELRSRLAPADVSDYYRARAATGVGLGPSFRTLRRAWAGPGEALGEVALPEDLGRNDLDIHPLVLDGCFQVVGVARNVSGAPGEATYLPFGWERMWLNGRLPDRVLCHVVMSEASGRPVEEPGEPPEVLTGEIRIYDGSGALLGGLSGYAVKRATRAALLSATEGVAELLYEVTWRDRALESALKSADFMPGAGTVAAEIGPFSDYLASADVDAYDRYALISDLERLSWSYALSTLQKLGWSRTSGEVIDPGALRARLGVIEEHGRLFRRMFDLLARAGVVEERGSDFAVLVGAGDPLPEGLPPDPEAFAEGMPGLYSHGLTEIGLFRRSGAALADVLRGRENPLTLLFSSGEPTAGDLYLKAPVARAANGLLADAVRALVAAVPEGCRLRVLEVGAGTGSATASVLPELPAGRFDYTYTDISAGFFAEAEERFGDAGGAIEYRPLDIEKNPTEQGFDEHGYDLIIASNVLHATRDLRETLAHCLAVLAPSGHLVALENLRGLGWMDLTFGQLDGWWRFADDYRPDHALMHPSMWRQALGDAGFDEAAVLGPDESASLDRLDKGVIVARGPSEVAGSRGTWLVVADGGGVAEDLAAELAARNQFVVLATGEGSEDAGAAIPGVRRADVDGSERESWRSLVAGLPGDVPFGGVVHLQALDGHGEGATAAPAGRGRDLRRNERARAAPGVVRLRCDSRRRRLVRHPGRSDRRARARRRAGRRDPLGAGQGRGPGGPSPSASDDRSRSRGACPAIRSRGRAAVSRPREPHRVPPRPPPRRPAGPARRRRRAPRSAAGALLGAGPGPRRRLRQAENQGAPGACAGAAGGSRRRRGDRAQLLGRVPLARLHRGRGPRQGDVRLRARRGSRRLVRVPGGPRGGPRLRRLRSADGDARGAGGARPGGHLRIGTGHRAERLRVGCSLLRLHGARAGRAGADPCRRGRSGPRGHPVGAGGGGGGVRHGQRTEAGLPPVARRRARLRQPHDRLRRPDPRGDRRRGRPRRPEQPHERGLHRRQPLLPRARRPVRRDGPKGHPRLRGDGGRPARRALSHPRTRRPQENRPPSGGGRTPWRDGAARHGRTGPAHPQQVAAGRSRRGARVHAGGPPHREDRVDDLSPRHG